MPSSHYGARRALLLLTAAALCFGAVFASNAGAAGWSLQSTPNLEPSEQEAEEGSFFRNRYEDVSCATDEMCMAVGSAEHSVAGYVPIAGLWDGESWSQTPMTDRREEGYDDIPISVSCSSPEWCVAVGYEWNIGMGTYLPLIEHWDGSEWELQPTPAGVENVSYIDDVDCTSASSCMAVGYWFDAPENRYRTLVLQWDGEKWSIMSSPDPVSYEYNVELRSVSCPSASACVAVGYYRTGPASFHSFALQWDGEEWSIAPDSGDETVWVDVSCTGASLAAIGCTAVNYSTNVHRFSGGKWSKETVPGGGVHTVSCSSATVCMATELTSSNPKLAVWAGGSWFLLTPVTFPGYFGGISCSVPVKCTVVGTTLPGGGAVKTLAQRFE